MNVCHETGENKKSLTASNVRQHKSFHINQAMLFGNSFHKLKCE